MKDKKTSNAVVRFILFLVVIVVFGMLGRIFKLDLEQIQGFLNSFPVFLSGFIFVGLYVVSTTFIWFGPKDILRLCAALLFGGGVSTVLVTVSEMINLIILFVLSRKMGRSYIQERFKIKSDRLTATGASKGLWGIWALRLNLLVPLRLIDLAYGLRSISLMRYFCIAIWVTPLRIFLQQYIMAIYGKAVFTDILGVSQGLMNDYFLLKFLAVYVMLWILTSVVAVIIKISKSA